MHKSAGTYLVVTSVTADTDFSFSRTASPAEKMVLFSMSYSEHCCIKTIDVLLLSAVFVADSDGTAFEARDLENDYGVTTSTRRPGDAKPHGKRFSYYPKQIAIPVKTIFTTNPCEYRHTKMGSYSAGLLN